MKKSLVQWRRVKRMTENVPSAATSSNLKLIGFKSSKGKQGRQPKFPREIVCCPLRNATQAKAGDAGGAPTHFVSRDFAALNNYEYDTGYNGQGAEAKQEPEERWVNA